MEEIWKVIYCNGYKIEISNKGNCIKNGKQANVFLSGRGYKTISLQTKKIRKNFLIHRLVAQAFIPNPNNKKTINHINGIKTDNRVENLEWATYSENNYHAIKNGLRTYTKRMKPILQIKNGTIVKEYISINSACRENHYDSKSISLCCRNINKSAYGFQWKYKDII